MQVYASKSECFKCRTPKPGGYGGGGGGGGGGGFPPQHQPVRYSLGLAPCVRLRVASVLLLLERIVCVG